MTAPGSSAAGNGTGPGRADGLGDGEQPAARAFITALHAAARALRLYPAENVAVRKALADLVATAERVSHATNLVTVRRAGDLLFVNDSRLRLTLDCFASIAGVQGLLRDAEVGGLLLRRLPEGREWVALLDALAISREPSPSTDPTTVDPLARLSARLEAQGVAAFELLPVTEGGDEQEAEVDTRERARRTYVRSLDVTREVISAARMGRSPGLKRVKRAVQGIVDAILTDPSSMIGLTTLREFDDYTFVHSVNVCILSVALGRRLELTRLQLLDLGLAALLHDIGKSRVPVEVLNKHGALDDEERALIRSHSWQGILALFRLPSLAARPWRAMVVAHEHHRKVDGTGYPETRTPRELSLFSRIVAVCDGYDAATSVRVYQSNPWTPADVLRGMRENPRLGFDRVIVKAFVNLTGIYPVGTVVVLDTFELAVVTSASPDPAALSRPLVRLLSDAQGNRTPDAPPCDLSERDGNGQFLRTIIRTEDPERHGIRVSDYVA